MIDQALFNSVAKHISGSLSYGNVDQLGVADGGVGLAKNKHYQQLDDVIKSQIDDIEEKLSNGEIEVGTAYGLSTEEINEIRDAVKPE